MIYPIRQSRRNSTDNNRVKSFFADFSWTLGPFDNKTEDIKQVTLLF